MHKLTILCVLGLFLSGCGQKGPLYHPESTLEQNKPAPESAIDANSSTPKPTEDNQ